MALDPAAVAKILAQIDRNELAQLGADLTSIPSPTGQEKAIGEFILNWFAANGLRAVRQDVEYDRPNAIGIVKGDGTGLSLGFNGHTDTSFTGTEEDRRMVAVMEPQSELAGKIVGTKVQGLGISNMKGGVAAFMMAGKALQMRRAKKLNHLFDAEFRTQKRVLDVYDHCPATRAGAPVWHEEYGGRWRGCAPGETPTR